MKPSSRGGLHGPDDRIVPATSAMLRTAATQSWSGMVLFLYRVYSVRRARAASPLYFPEATAPGQTASAAKTPSAGGACQNSPRSRPAPGTLRRR
jgi:hypothetical protein